MLNFLFTLGVTLTDNVNLLCRILGPAQVTFCLGSGYDSMAFSHLHLMVVLPEGGITGRLLCVRDNMCLCFTMLCVNVLINVLLCH